MKCVASGFWRLFAIGVPSSNLIRLRLSRRVPYLLVHVVDNKLGRTKVFAEGFVGGVGETCR